MAPAFFCRVKKVFAPLSNYISLNWLKMYKNFVSLIVEESNSILLIEETRENA